MENNLQATQKSLSSVPTLVMESMNDTLRVEISFLKVSIALRDIPSDKTPRHDTIPKELLQELWDDIEEDLFTFIWESLERGEITKSIKYGLT